MLVLISETLKSIIAAAAALSISYTYYLHSFNQVVLFTGQRLLHLHNLTGSQVGAYFGHSVAVLDVNGDGLDDIAIGAPLHSEPMERYEAGRVYVVYQNEDVSLIEYIVLILTLKI